MQVIKASAHKSAQRPQEMLTGIAVMLFLLMASHVSFAQATGEVTGSTTDVTHAVLQNANVALLNRATGTTLTTKSTSDGIYRFPSVPAGTYDLKVSAPGFGVQLIQGVVVNVGRTTSVDAALSVTATQQVTVTANTQSLDIDNGYKGQLITSKQVENLPLQTRSPQALVMLSPGVVSSPGGNTTDRQASGATTIVSDYTINGGIRSTNGGFNEYLVDGISMTNLRDGSVIALPSLGAIQEFQVQSGGLKAEYGNTVGGVISYATKRGTNTLHGLIFEDYRGTLTNGIPALPVGSGRPLSNFNQFGGNLGGPVFLPKVYDGRNRTFFFIDYDGSRYLPKTPETETIPTALMHQGIFTDLTTSIYEPNSSSTPATRTAFMNNTIPPGDFNAIGVQIMSLFPYPNLPGTANNYQGTEDLNDPVDIITGRIDQTFGTRQTVGFKLTRVQSTAVSIYGLGLNDASTQDIIFPTRNYSGFYNFSITPTLVYGAALGYTHFTREFFDPSNNTIGGGYFGYTVTPAPASGSVANVRPTATFDIYSGVGTGAPQDQISAIFQINQTLSWNHGHHFIQVGADIRRYNVSGLVTAGDPNGAFGFSASQTSNGTSTTGNSAASLLLGLPNTEIIQQEPITSVTNYVNAFYVTDDYRLTPELTVNLGLRYEYTTPLTEAHNNAGWFDSVDTNPIVNQPGIFQYAGLNGNPNSITTGDYHNVGPRIGFAYAPKYLHLRGTTVLRGAFGMFYGPIPATGFFSPTPGSDSTLNPVKPSADAAPATLTTSYTLPTPNGVEGAAADLGLAVTQPLNRFAQNPIVYEWNLGIQQSLPAGWIFEILYSGNRGTHLLDLDSINLPAYSTIQAAIAVEQASGKSGTALAYLNATVPNPRAGEVPGTLGDPTITVAQASAPFPQFSTITALRGDRDSIYHSLQTTLQRRLGSNLNVLFGYTLGKLIDDTTEYSATSPSITGSFQDPYNFRDARGPSSYDITNIVTGSVVYAFPFGRGQRFLQSGVWGAIAGGFQLTSIVNLQSGPPLGIYQSGANGLGLGAQRPDKIGDPLTGRHYNTNGSLQWLNPAAYALVDGRFGTAPIRDGQVRGPGYAELDMGLQRNFHIYKQLNTAFRAEAFNLTNHTNLGLPTQDLSSSAFGQINSIAPLSYRAVQADAQIRF